MEQKIIKEDLQEYLELQEEIYWLERDLEEKEEHASKLRNDSEGNDLFRKRAKEVIKIIAETMPDELDIAEGNVINGLIEDLYFSESEKLMELEENEVVTRMYEKIGFDKEMRQRFRQSVNEMKEKYEGESLEEIEDKIKKE